MAKNKWSKRAGRKPAKNNLTGYLPQYLAPYAKPAGQTGKALQRAQALYEKGGFCPVDFANAREPALVISLPGIGPSFNWFWSGVHWATRKALASAWHDAVEKWCFHYEPKPLRASYQCLFVGEFAPGQNLYDYLNLAPTAKIMEDALVKQLVILEDNAHILSHGSQIPIRGPRTMSHLIFYENTT
jgi:hypothetical protein